MSVTITSGTPASKSLPLITLPPSALIDSVRFILYPLLSSSLKALSTCLAPSTFNIPTVGFSIPIAFAVIIPLIPFLTIASTLWGEVVPVVVAIIISFPFPGVTTLPTVETPIGKL